MASYIVKTPGNPQYSGRLFGVQFNNGKALVSKETIDPDLGYTVEQIAQSMKTDFGYDVINVPSPGDDQAGEEQPAGDANISVEVAEAARKESQELPPVDTPESRAQQEEGDGYKVKNPDKHIPKPSPYEEPARMLSEEEQRINPVQVAAPPEAPLVQGGLLYEAAEDKLARAALEEQGYELKEDEKPNLAVREPVRDVEHTNPDAVNTAPEEELGEYKPSERLEKALQEREQASRINSTPAPEEEAEENKADKVEFLPPADPDADPRIDPGDRVTSEAAGESVAPQGEGNVLYAEEAEEFAKQEEAKQPKARSAKKRRK